MTSKLTLLRQKLNLTQIEFSKETEIPQPTLSRHEKNNTVPYDFLDVLYNKYNVNLNWLIADADNMFNINENVANSQGVEQISKHLNTLSKFITRTNLLHGILDTHFLHYNDNKLGNKDQIYFMAFSERQFKDLKDSVIEYFLSAKRDYIFIDCKNKTYSEIMLSILNFKNIETHKKMTNYDIHQEIADLLLNNNIVIIFQELSKSKIGRVENCFRGLIKTIDDAHFKKIIPKASLIFLDYPAFLEKHYEYIGGYLTTNLISSP